MVLNSCEYCKFRLYFCTKFLEILTALGVHAHCAFWNCQQIAPIRKNGHQENSIGGVVLGKTREELYKFNSEMNCDSL